jgi:hypothetical protein
MPYGKRDLVEKLLRDMEAQKHLLKMTKGKETKEVWLESQIRVLPFGIYEYIFPKEDLDIVLHSLIEYENRYKIPAFVLMMIRKVLHLDKIPEYKKDKKYLWRRENVNIIPLGIREDGEITEQKGQMFEGFTHEAM